MSGLASRNSDRRPPLIIQSLRASRGSAVSAGGGAELSVEVSADAMMPVYLAEQYHIDMVTAIIPEKEEMLSVKEIGDILAVPLRECGATVAYLGGEYVRADRNGDIRDHR